MWSCHEALKFGRKDVQVTVLRLGWDPRATAPTLIDRIFRARATRKASSPELPAAIDAPADTESEDGPSAPEAVAVPESEATPPPVPPAQ
jgi:hypothetical protein